jgi:mercuric ion transport protein
VLYAAETVSLIEEKSMSVTRVLDKTSSFGALVSAMSCAGCFPALGSLGAALGLGFLGQYEGFLFRKLLPGLAVLALLVNAWAWYRHRQLARGLLSVVGPIAVLAALLVFWSYDWSIYLFYAGIALMLVASILDLLRPVRAVQCPASN